MLLAVKFLYLLVGLHTTFRLILRRLSRRSILCYIFNGFTFECCSIRILIVSPLPASPLVTAGCPWLENADEGSLGSLPLHTTTRDLSEVLQAWSWLSWAPLRQPQARLPTTAKSWWMPKYPSILLELLGRHHWSIHYESCKTGLGSCRHLEQSGRHVPWILGAAHDCGCTRRHRNKCFDEFCHCSTQTWIRVRQGCFHRECTSFPRILLQWDESSIFC